MPARRWCLHVPCVVPCVVSLVALGDAARAAAQPTAPPNAPVRVVIDTLHGVPLPDPYRYFEDARDTVARAWVAAQGNDARRILDAIPGRAPLVARLTVLDTLAAFVGRPQEAGRRLFYRFQRATDPVPVLHVRDGLAGADRVLADPAAHRPPGYAGPVALGEWAVSRDGRVAAYTVAAGGSEFHSLYVRDVATGRLLGDSVGGHDVSDPAFSPDGRVLFYSHGPAGPAEALTPTRFRHVAAYRHVLGTPVSQDRPVLGPGGSARLAIDSLLYPAIAVTPRADLAIGVADDGISPVMTFYAAPLADVVAGRVDVRWRRIAALHDSVRAVTAVGDTLYLLSRKGAPNGRLLRLVWTPPQPGVSPGGADAEAPLDLARADVLLEGGAREIRSVDAGRDALYLTVARQPVGTELLRIAYATRARGAGVVVDTLRPPFAGAEVGIAPRAATPGAYVIAGSFVRAPRWYVYDPAARRYVAAPLPQPSPLADVSDAEVLDTMVVSRDGVRVPLTVIARRGLARDGRAPTLLYAYGAFGVRDDPIWSPAPVSWVERGGVYAVCHARGGGALGEAWHVAGMGERKPNTWRDLIACGEWLVRAQITSPARLGGFGASAGGITIGRAVEERPDLFGAAVMGVPVADVVRFELATPGGDANTHEFGSVRTPAGLAAVMGMSAYRQVVDGTRYPALMVVTGANDRRVPWWVAAKFAARLQAATASGRPVLLRYDAESGHGMGATRAQDVSNAADTNSFLLWQLGEPGFQPAAPAGASSASHRP